MKKTISLILSLIILATCFTSFAYAKDDTLKFGEDGKFTILNISDIQDGYPLNELTRDYIEKTVDIALQQAEAMRQSILKKAFEGEL